MADGLTGDVYRNITIFILILESVNLGIHTFIQYLSVKHWSEICRKSTANVAIVVISLSNLALAIVSLIQQVAHFAANGRDDACLIYGFGGAMILSGSLCCTCILSYLRYRDICMPTLPKIRVKYLVYMLTLVYASLYSFAALHYIVGTGYVQTSSKLMCTPFHPAPENATISRFWYYFFPTCSVIIVAFTTMGIGSLYVAMYRHIRNVSLALSNSPSCNTSHREIGGDVPVITPGNNVLNINGESSVTPNHKDVSFHPPKKINRTSNIRKERSCHGTLEKNKMDRVIFYKILAITTSTFMCWMPALCLTLATCFFRVKVPPVLDAMMVLLYHFSPFIDGLLIIILITHYRKWTMVILTDVKRKILDCFT